jgi:hypothetical protein
MTMTPGTQVRAIAEAAEHQARLLPPTRYRHPGDVIRLITAGLVLAGALAVTITTHATYAGVSAAAVTALAGRVLAGLAGAAVLASAVVIGMIHLAGGQRPRDLAAGAGQWPWLTGASLAGPGGIGAFEAAAIVGLTGVGLANGPAVSAVVLYRLATYWLPVAPGWLCWRVLQRRDYV